MESWQAVFLISLSVLGTAVAFLGYRHSNQKKNAYGDTILLGILGIYVWGDAVIFGVFWALAALVSVILNDWILFWLITSLFWVVRSFGETMYWFNQQFSPVMREDPKRHKFLYKRFHNDSVWFIYQIMQQCITVVSLVFAIHFADLWLAR